MLRLAVALLLVLALTVADAGASGYTITTVAGTGASGSTGDGGPAIRATLNMPQALAQLADGSLLVAERSAGRVRKIDTAGQISLAATGVSEPTGLAVAPDGQTFYVAEYGGRRVSRVDHDGTLTVIAGDGSNGPAGIPGTAGGARLRPYGLAVEPDGDLLIALYLDNQVLRISAGVDGIVGPGDPIAVASLVSRPTDIWLEPDGSYLVTSFDNHQVRRIDSDGTVSTFAGTTMCSGSTLLCGDGGPALAAYFDRPFYVIGDGAGGHLIADYGTKRIRRISASGVVSTFAGTGVGCSPVTALCGDGGPPANATLDGPRGLVRDPVSGTIYFTDGAANRVRAIVPNPTAQGGTGSQGPPGPTGPQGPAGANGADGTDGADGADGAPGADGARGANGADGLDGPAGQNGRDGAPGPDGAPGADAIAGLRLPLLAILPASRVSRRRSAPVTLSAYVVGPARLRLTATRGGRPIRSRVRTIERVGRVRFRLGRLARGHYRITLSATRGKRTFIDHSRLVVR